VRREQERHRALCHTVSVASTRTPSVAAVVASGTGAPYRGGVCCGSQGHAFVRDPRRLRAMRRCRSWIAIALEYRTGTWYRAVIERSGDRAIYAATPRIAALLHSSYIVCDLAIWRSNLQRYVLLVPANRCDASLLVHRLRSSDRLCDAAWLLVPATRPCAIHHPSSAIGRHRNRFCSSAVSRYERLAPTPYIILRQRSGDLAIDSAALLFPGTRDSPLHHSSSFFSIRATA
jgi:hypothetical protein